MMENYTSYKYSLFDTPIVRPFLQQVTIGEMLSIHAVQISQNPGDNTFTIGGKPCLSTEPESASATRTEPDYSGSVAGMVLYEDEEFECTVPDIPSGIYRLVMHVHGKGWAYTDLSTSTVLFQPALTGSVSPASGSLRGGQLLEILVPELSSTDVALTRVDIGNTPCPIQRIYDDYRVTCLTQAARDDGYSSVVTGSNALAYWSLQTDYFDSSGSYLSSDGTTNFRSGGILGRVADATVQGDVTTRTDGISGNSFTDQSVHFSGSYIEIPSLEEFSSPTGFGMELWVKVTDSDSSEKYRVIVDSASFASDAASGYILAINPCNHMEYWVSTGLKLSNVSAADYNDCPPISDPSYNCSQSCEGHAYIEDPGSSTGELPPGVWQVIRTAEFNWSTWHQVVFGWSAENSDTCTLDTTPCPGEQSLYIDAGHIGSPTTSYLPSDGTPMTVGGSHRFPLWTSPNSAYDIDPFVGLVDEISFYSVPLSDSVISQHHFYGTSESQPIWVTVEGRNGIGTGVVPNVDYPEWTLAFESEEIVDWDDVQNSDIIVENTSALRFDWTG